MEATLLGTARPCSSGRLRSVFLSGWKRTGPVRGLGLDKAERILPSKGKSANVAACPVPFAGDLRADMSPTHGRHGRPQNDVAVCRCAAVFMETHFLRSYLQGGMESYYQQGYAQQYGDFDASKRAKF